LLEIFSCLSENCNFVPHLLFFNPRRRSIQSGSINNTAVSYKLGQQFRNSKVDEDEDQCLQQQSCKQDFFLQKPRIRPGLPQKLIRIRLQVSIWP